MKTNRLLVFTVFAVIAFALTVGSVSAADYNYTGPANSSSPGYHADNQHTGQFNYTGPQTNTTKWISDSSSGTSVRIAIGSDGTIYAAGLNKILTAFAPNGTKKWNYSADVNIMGIAVGNNETIYITLANGLRAFYSNGTEKWFYDTSSQDSYSIASGSYPVIGSDGTIYVGAYHSNRQGLLYAFDPDGTVKWGLNTPDDDGNRARGIRSSPAIGPDGTIYVCTSGSTTSYSGTLYALDPAAYALDPLGATPKWAYTLPSGNLQGNSPAVGADGTIYIVTRIGLMYAINPDGTQKWNTTASSGSSPSDLAIASNGTIYVNEGSSLYALDPVDGTKTLVYTGFSGIVYNVLIGADGTIYASDYTSSSKMYAINPNGTLKWSYNSYYIGQGAVIGSDGTLYFSSSNLIALQDLVGDFTVNPSGLGVSFTDTSSNIPTGWSWDFGDGATSTEQNPVHVYSHAGTYNVTLTVTIAGASSTVQKEVTVNQAPVISVGNKSTNEGQALGFTVNGSDPDGDPLIYDVTGLPTGATFNTTTGAFSWTPTYDQSGNYTVTFTVSDGKSTVSETITITVNNVNRVPVLGFAGITVNENQPLNFNLGGSDEDGDTLTYSATGLPAGATFNSATGVFSWIPSFAQAGTYHITFNVFDGYSTASKIISIIVNDVDNIAPKVTKVDPVKNAVIRVTNKAINFTFDEQIKNGSLWVELKNSSGVPLKIATKVVGNVLTITPSSALANGKYTLTLNAGAFTDLVGNGMAAYSTVFSVDSVAPNVKTIDPKSGATKVAASKTLKVVFSEAIKAGNMSLVTLKNSSGKAVSYKYKISGSTLTITPNSKLTESLYTLTIGKGAVTDLVGNQVAAKTSKFSVGTAPTVSKIDPKNGATKVSRSKTIQVTFNEAIKKGTYKIVLKDNKGKTVKVTASINGKVLSLKHAKLAANTKYKLVIYAGSVTDKAGNPVASKTYTFTTGKT